MIYDFMNLLLYPFGISVLGFNDLINLFSTFNNWFDVLNPQVLISWLFYVSFAYGMLYIVFILPFRFFKSILRVPNSKGVRK